MSGLRHISLFSFFRQAGPKGFRFPPRYYDPVTEAQEERAERLRREVDGDNTLRRELFAERMRHSWQRRSSDRARSGRLLIVLALVAFTLYLLYKGYVLLDG